jgi:hypothetical protein
MSGGDTGGPGTSTALEAGTLVRLDMVTCSTLAALAAGRCFAAGTNAVVRCRERVEAP